MRKNRNNHQNLTIQGMIKIKNTSIKISYKTQYTAEVASCRDQGFESQTNRAENLSEPGRYGLKFFRPGRSFANFP